MGHSMVTILTVAAAEIGVLGLVVCFVTQLARVIDRLEEPPPKAPQQPSWWPRFERQFAAYVESLRP
jgi:hypothetical protein